MTRCLVIRGFPLLLLAILLFPQEAAAKGIILITHGDSVSHLGEVAPQFKELVRKETGTDPEVGIVYSSFGVFSLDLWTWGGEYCLYKDKQVWKLPPEAAALLMNVSPSELGKPFTYRFPPGLMILIGIAVVAILVKVFKKRPQDRVKELFEDARYQKALQIISEHCQREEAARNAKAAEPGGQEGAEKEPDGNAAFEAAIQSLMSEGIPREEAEQNLALLLHVCQQAAAEDNEQGGAAAPAS